ADAVDLEVDLVLALELDLFVVEAPGEVDVAVGGDDGGGVEAMELPSSDLSGHRREYTKGIFGAAVTGRRLPFLVEVSCRESRQPGLRTCGWGPGDAVLLKKSESVPTAPGRRAPESRRGRARP